ncbi:hypothetical protein WMY93_023886 [Mugilogobius chulae]|uniref:Uncharacterized protein n=1 Tax=Mugilogobius chulae TaxID=88201 RepID=A0AAW0NG38_9GOBI
MGGRECWRGVYGERSMVYVVIEQVDDGQEYMCSHGAPQRRARRTEMVDCTPSTERGRATNDVEVLRIEPRYHNGSADLDSHCRVRDYAAIRFFIEACHEFTHETEMLYTSSTSSWRCDPVEAREKAGETRRRRS